MKGCNPSDHSIHEINVAWLMTIRDAERSCRGQMTLPDEQTSRAKSRNQHRVTSGKRTPVTIMAEQQSVLPAVPDLGFFHLGRHRLARCLTHLGCSALSAHRRKHRAVQALLNPSQNRETSLTHTSHYQSHRWRYRACSLV